MAIRRTLTLVVACVLSAATVVAAQDTSDADLERASAGRTITLGSPASGGVATIPIEVYVARVLAGEAERDAPDGELQALAVAIRTFSIFNIGRHRRDGYDLCDTTHCQVPRAATASTRRAALATAGRILTYKGSPAEVFYSASCGGRSENAATVWPGANLPYLVSVEDDVHDDDPEWTLALTLAEIERVLRDAGFAGRLTDIRVEERSTSKRVATLRVRGMRPDVIAGQAFRMAIGPTRLRSTAFSLLRRGGSVEFRGRGYGHGVGMCVIGAGRRARRGETADAILAKYYPGLRLTTLDRGSVPAIEVAVAPPPKAAAPIPVSPTISSGIVVRVPMASRVSAVELERQARRARDELATALGTSVSPITIELHDSLDRFREATGRPWWVSTATKGAAIDLAPLALLEQRDGLDVALRQALVDVFVTPALTDRPAWVRVGASRFFARAPGSGLRSSGVSKVRCPSDAELTLAISASAQRDADSRAEACFARSYAEARDWRTVR